MATYKVIQDIEAEDKLIGPLTLRQFIYGAVAAVNIYLSYLLASKGAAFMMVFFLPVAVVAGFFAFPWGRDQPTEIWALAKIRFALKPRRRIWDQSGVKELVTITAPKQVLTHYSNNLSQEEVQSRLEALASTIDTRGWAIKNANVNAFSPTAAPADSDRLISPASLPKPVDDSGVLASDDILDERNNASAQRLQGMINKSAQDHRNKLIESLNSSTPDPGQAQQKPANYWFLNQPAAPAAIPKDMVTFGSQTVAPGTNSGGAATASSQDDAKILAELEEHKRQSQIGAYSGHMHTIQPLSQQDDSAAAPAAVAVPATQPQSTPVPAANPADDQAQSASAPVTPAPQAAILQLASNDDLTVATLAREAERALPQDEVVIKLH